MQKYSISFTFTTDILLENHNVCINDHRQETMVNAKVSAQQQCMYEGP